MKAIQMKAVVLRSRYQNNDTPSILHYKKDGVLFVLNDYFENERSLMTSPAKIKPATEGTNETLPGIDRRSVHFRSVPGGQIQLVLHEFEQSSISFIGSSVEKTTFKCLIRRFFSSFRIILATGHMVVL